MAYDFLLSSSTMTKGLVYYAKLAGSSEPKITVGYKTLYHDNYGLYNTAIDQNLIYNPANYEAEKGFWAYFIYPTAMAESKGSFFCLNTYDRARFTFGFMQYAAHVPNGDFVRFFRSLLKLPNANAYFPRLNLINNRIHYVNETGASSQLENDNSTTMLSDYFNPSLSEIENQEVICSARMVHWAMNDPAHRKAQVDTAIDNFKRNMIGYNTRFNLNGATAKVCQLICDIRHQGRGDNDMIAMALNTGGNWESAYTNLAKIGYVTYKNRIDTVRKVISDLENQSKFQYTYRSADNSFV
jgi:hypothetical protein